MEEMTCWRTKRAAAAISFSMPGAGLRGDAAVVSFGTALSMLVLCCKARGGARQKIAVEKNFRVRGERFCVRRNFTGKIARHHDDHGRIGFAQGFRSRERTAVALADERLQMRVDQKREVARIEMAM